MLTVDQLNDLVSGVTRVRTVDNGQTGTVIGPLPNRHRTGTGSGNLQVQLDGEYMPVSISPSALEIVP